MATLATNVSFQCLGLDGKPLAGGKVYTYEAGTTTPKTTYTTIQGDVPNSNPVILDQNGKAKIYLGDGSYRFRILDSNDALVDDTNDISRYVTQSEFAVFQQIINEGISQLTEVREQIDVYVTTAIGNQKGFENGIAPLDANVKIPHVHLPDIVNNTSTDDPNKILSAGMGKNLQNQVNSLQSQITEAWNKQLGIGQTWQSVLGSRGNNVTYLNSTARPIQVFITADFGWGSVTVGGVSATIADEGSYGTISFIVPSGVYYSINATGTGGLEAWMELR